MLNSTELEKKARQFFICLYFSFYEQLKFPAKLSWAWKQFYNLLPLCQDQQSVGPDLDPVISGP